MEDIQDQEAHNLEIINHIAFEFLGGKKNAKTQRLGGGSCNDNYLVEVPDKKIVVRMSKPHREYKALFEYKKEAWCIGKSHQLQIPVSKVFEVGQWDDRAYMIQSYVEGFIPSGAQTLPVWEKLGEYAQKIHSIAVTGWGENLTEEGVFDASWEKYVQYNINSLNGNDPLIAMDILTGRLSKEIKSLFERVQAQKFKFGLCHGDIALRNTLVNSEGIIYLLDWGCARAEVVPHYDINEILLSSKPDESALQAFLAGYGISQGEFEDMKADLNVLLLLHKVDTLRWAIDKKPEEIPRVVADVKEVLGKCF